MGRVWADTIDASTESIGAQNTFNLGNGKSNEYAVRVLHDQIIRKDNEIDRLRAVIEGKINKADIILSAAMMILQLERIELNEYVIHSSMFIKDSGLCENFRRYCDKAGAPKK